MIRRLKGESGYSLVEVMAAIMILAIAIIPMVGMFDAGLRAASSSGNYDTARALANRQLEQAKSIGYDAVKTSFPSGSCVLDPSDSDGEDTCVSEPAPAGFPASFTYSVEKQYLKQPSTDPAPGTEIFTESTSADDTGLIRVTVTVRWGGNTYETTGLVAR